MPTIAFEAKTRQQVGIAIIDLHGDINGAADADLNTAYDAAEKANPSKILLNFVDVSYINSTGIALIVGLLARARKSHRPMLVCGLSDHYTEIFNITRLADFMDIFTDEASALSSPAPNSIDPKEKHDAPS